MNILLKKQLEPLEKYFNKKDIVEICINKPGEVFIETLDGWKVKNDPLLTAGVLEGIAKTLATEQGQAFDEETPLLATAIPEFSSSAYTLIRLSFKAQQCISSVSCSEPDASSTSISSQSL